MSDHDRASPSPDKLNRETGAAIILLIVLRSPKNYIFGFGGFIRIPAMTKPMTARADTQGNMPA
jgi:hypothetical protein